MSHLSGLNTVTEFVVTSIVEAYPGVADRILADVRAREPLEAYLRAGGYAPLDDPSSLLTAIEGSGLRGRGGAAFPFGRKVRAVRRGPDPRVVVANGEEGEPISVKDRWLLRHRPHLVLDGLRLAAAVVDAAELHAYVSDQAAAASLARAVEELAEHDVREVDLKITVAAPSYVAGEETALVRAVNGGPARPTDKPPRPFDEGIGGRPTLVSNVETLANLPLLQRPGTTFQPGGNDLGPKETFLLTLTGGPATGLYEVPFGVTLRNVIAWRGLDPDTVAGFLMGGYFAGLIGPRALDLPLDYDALRAAGSGLGCGAVAVVSTGQCPVEVAAAVMTYFARENAGQCGSCFNGTAAMRVALESLRDHRAGPVDLDRLSHWSSFLRGRGACGTLDGATNLAGSLLREFPDVVAAHLQAPCDLCVTAPRRSGPPYATDPPLSPIP